MKNTNIKILFAVALLLAAGCRDSAFDSYQIQSVDNHGAAQNIISTAVTATSGTQFVVLAVDASTTAKDYDVIPVVLASANTADQDIHITMVPNPDSLATFNSRTFDEHDKVTQAVTVPHPELYYAIAGSSGTPTFTLVDGGVVTIPKGSNVGYLKINTTSADYFAGKYAFSYKIAAVREARYIVSANNNFGIVGLIPKNHWDGIYDLILETDGWSAYGISDGMPGDYGRVALETSGPASCIFDNLVKGGNRAPGFTTGNEMKTDFGATVPNFVFDSSNKLIDVFNSVADDGRGRSFSLNPAALPTENLYDPVKKVIIANYLFHQSGRPDCTVKMKMTYVKSR